MILNNMPNMPNNSKYTVGFKFWTITTVKFNYKFKEFSREIYHN